MGSVLHGSARTTPRIRAELQASKASTRSLAAEYGLNPKTVRKWRGRTTTVDEPMGPTAPKSTVLTATPPLHEGNAAVAPLLDTALSTLKVSDAIAVYSGHFRDDTIGGTGTCAVKCSIPASRDGTWMVPLRMSDLQLIHVKAGFTADGQ
jgi:transposase-like protein